MCTTLLVGKRASANGRNMISRNEDFHKSINPKNYIFNKSQRIENRIYKSVATGVVIPLPELNFSYTSCPDLQLKKYDYGQFGEAGINEKRVAMSATESFYANERVLKYDPLIENGIAEDSILDIVLPFISTAREGVERLGKLIEEYGSVEGNGIAFSDDKDIWYMEILTGHHYIAIRIPDDSYAIAPNNICIEEVELDDKENIIHSSNIEEFIESNGLNKNSEKINIRDIFGTYTKQDRGYNTCRAWYAHKYFDNEGEYTPTSDDIAFIKKAKKKITKQDMINILRSHYNGTEYDPLSDQGTKKSRKKFRPISLSRTQESHILEVDEYSVQYIAMATNAYTPYVPFFTDILDTNNAYKGHTFKVDTKKAYHLFKLFSYYAENHRDIFKEDTDKYLIEMEEYATKRVEEVRNKVKNEANISEYLTKENEKTVKYILRKTRKLLNSFIERSLDVSELKYSMDKNL